MEVLTDCSSRNNTQQQQTQEFARAHKPTANSNNTHAQTLREREREKRWWDQVVGL